MSASALHAAEGRATGKVILLGEHVVVHGHPAIVAGLDRGVTVRITPGDTRPEPPADGLSRATARAAELLAIQQPFAVDVDGDLPIGMGLGSSAALAVALLRALAAASGRVLDETTTAAQAHEIERLFHGTPSGVDGTAATYGGVLWFEAGTPPHHEALTLTEPLPLVVVLSRTPHATSHTVGSLRERAAASPRVYQPVFGAIASLVASARDALLATDRSALGELMTMNHGLLRACGISTPELDAIVEVALGAGAAGAKLTGAGGGGAVLALPAGDGEPLAQALRDAGHDCFVTTVGGTPQRRTTT